MKDILPGILLPFLGTTLGAACVFLLKKELSASIQKVLLGFASGVMVAASVWSLLIPAMNMSSGMDRFAWIPAVMGFLLGVAFLLILDKIIPHLHMDGEKEGPKAHIGKTAMMALAVTLHNIPEGMAVGVVLASMITDSADINAAGALALSLGIAIQNFPEGAIVSMPMSSSGTHKGKSFLYGLASGAVEPIAAVVTILAAELITPILPYLLAFAAGAMIYVVVEELIPESAQGCHSNLGTIGFALGFALMMILEVALG